METTTSKTWQEDMAELIAQVPEEMRPRVHDFLLGALATIKAEQEQRAS